MAMAAFNQRLALHSNRGAAAQQGGGLLSLVNGCARDQSFGENHLEQLKKKSAELIAQLELARSAFQVQKQQKTTLEEELKCLEVELSAAESTIQSRQREIAEAKMQLDALKLEEATDRDAFIKEMLELNSRISQLQHVSTVCSSCQ